MQIIKKWRIIVYFDLSDKSLTFIINDNFYSNMLRKLLEIGFDFEPTKIEITEVVINVQKNVIYNSSLKEK